MTDEEIEIEIETHKTLGIHKVTLRVGNDIRPVNEATASQFASALRQLLEHDLGVKMPEKERRYVIVWRVIDIRIHSGI
jgi:hypothetical protein